MRSEAPQPITRLDTRWLQRLNDRFLTRLQMAVFMHCDCAICHAWGLCGLHVAFQITWIRYLTSMEINTLAQRITASLTKSATTKINSVLNASRALSSLTYFKGQPHYFYISLPAPRGRCQGIAYLLPASIRTVVQQILNHVNGLKESHVLCIFA